MKLTDTQMKQLQVEGFLILNDVFSERDVELLREPVKSLVAENVAENSREANSDVIRNILSLHRRHSIYSKLIRHPNLLEPARQILGPQIYAQQVKINLKEGFDGGAFEWHTDFATHSRRDGVPKPLAINIHIFLDDVTEFNGPLWFVPKSHREKIPEIKSVDGEKWELWTVPHDAVSRLVDRYGLVSAKGKKGTVLIFGDELLHVSGPNISPYPRWIFSVIYNPVSNQATKNVPPTAHEHDREPLEMLDEDLV